jgi:hypothetical protein
MDQRVAVGLRRGCEQEPGLFLPSQAESVECADGTNLECVERHLQVIDRRSRRRKMEDGVEVPGNVNKGRHICAHESEPVALQKMFHITGIASGEIVETDDFIAFIQEPLTKVRSKKASPSSHRSASTPHVFPFPPGTKLYDRPPATLRSSSKDALLGHLVQPSDTITRQQPRAAPRLAIGPQEL